jgi:hypothetical protein
VLAQPPALAEWLRVEPTADALIIGMNLEQPLFVGKGVGAGDDGAFEEQAHVCFVGHDGLELRFLDTGNLHYMTPQDDFQRCIALYRNSVPRWVTGHAIDVMAAIDSLKLPVFVFWKPSLILTENHFHTATSTIRSCSPVSIVVSSTDIAASTAS